MFFDAQVLKTTVFTMFFKQRGICAVFCTRACKHIGIYMLGLHCHLVLFRSQFAKTL